MGCNYQVVHVHVHQTDNHYVLSHTQGYLAVGQPESVGAKHMAGATWPFTQLGPGRKGPLALSSEEVPASADGGTTNGSYAAIG